MRRVELTGEREIDRFESVAARVRRLALEAHVVVIDIDAGGTVGRHPAATHQLFAVVRGSGWVAGGDARPERSRLARRWSGMPARSTSRAPRPGWPPW